jgi:putative transposase
MGWQPTRLTREQLEERRLTAARLLRAQQSSQAEIAREVGVSRASVTRWKQRLEQEGLHGLRRRSAPGRASSLTAAQWHQLFRLLRRGAHAAGFDTDRWTQRRIATVIQREFGVPYHVRSRSRALRAWDWSPQRPLLRAKERDEALVEAWLRRDWPRIKRGLAAAGVPLPSWTRRVTRFGPAWLLPGHRSAIPPC